MAVSLESLAYELSLRGLAQQERVLDELRARSGTLLAAASLVASFLGGRALDRSGLDMLNVTAGFSFLATIAGTVYILAPKGELTFALGGSTVYGHFESGGQTSTKPKPPSRSGSTRYATRTRRSSTV